MRYRSEIDGLRAVAVIPVILFHAGFTTFSGGYVGVDVFFVISGFLITSIIIDELEQGSFSILNFYERRLRRIVPGLFFVILCCLPFAWLWMLPSQFESFSASVAAASVAMSNILFWNESGYFAAAALEKPLLHTWSLAVEEQYYILFPPIVMLLWRFGRNRVFHCIVVIAIVSLIISELGWRIAPDANFFLAPSRIWELLAGSICAFLQFGKAQKSNQTVSAFGFILIILAIFFYDENTPFPSLYALAPVLGTAFVIMYGTQGTWVMQVLSTKLFVGIGLISYSAYLWHYPLFAFARIRSQFLPEQWLLLLLAIMSIALAYLSWRYIEQPFRKKTIPLITSRGAVFSLTGLMGSAFIAFGLYGNLTNNNLGPKLEIAEQNGKHLGNYQWDNNFLQRQTWNLIRELTGEKKYKLFDNISDNKLWYSADERHKILVIGNSHSRGLFNLLSSSKKVLSTYQIARYGVQIRDIKNKDNLYNSPNYLAADYIFLATSFNYRDIDILPMVIERILADNKTPVIVLNKPKFRRKGVKHLADSLVSEFSSGDKPLNVKRLVTRINTAYFKALKKGERTKQNHLLKQIARKYGVVALNRKDYICDYKAKICFGVSDKLDKHFYDKAHTTLEGAAFFGARVDKIDWLKPIR